MKSKKIKAEKIQNMNQLAKAITLLEGKRVSLPIAQVKEVLGIISDLRYQSDWIDHLLLLNGRRRAKKK